MDYQEYINSPEWQRKRQQRLEIDKYECGTCGGKGDEYRLEVHHKPESYARIPNESIEDDLTTLCSDCHRVITDLIRQRRYSNREYTVETLEVRIERRVINDVETSEIQIDLIQPVNDAQRTVGRSNQSVVKVTSQDYLKAKQDRR